MPEFRKSSVIALSVWLGLAAAGLAEATVIETVSLWDGAGAIAEFGEPDTATYGQTFIAPANRLESFTFYINDFLDPDFVDFEAYVYEWDGAKATGPALFASGAMSTTNNGGADGFEQFTINTGGIALIPGNAYVAFFSASNLFDGSGGLSEWGFVGGNPYTDGDFVFMNNGANFGDLFTENWDFFLDDLAFEMVFEAPEPATLALFCLGFGACAIGRRRRQP